MGTSHVENGMLSVQDNLNLLDMDVPDIPENIIFPDELNSYLRDRLQYLIHENGMLKKNLHETEELLQTSQTKVNELQNKVEEFGTNKNFVIASNVASSKIVELSKKLRDKNSEVEVLKTKCSKLEKIIAQLDRQKNSEIQTEPHKEPEPAEEYESQIKMLQEKLNTTTNKLFEAKNLNMQLKNDLKIASKLLQQEVGENFDTLRNTSSNSNWRGRAQIICDLQQKNNDLKEKLKQLQDKDLSPASESNLPKSRTDKRLEALNKENSTLKQALEETRRKLESSKARCKVLESEVNISKTKLSTITEQHERDCEMINNLMGRVTSTRDEQDHSFKEKEHLIQKLREENKNLKLELSRQICKFENLQANTSQITPERHDSPKVTFAATKADQQNQKIISHLEVEKTRLLELVELLKKKLDAERETQANTQVLLRSERQKTAKLESKIARMQIENSEKGSVQSSYSVQNLQKQSRASLQDQLELAEEHIKALQTRLEIEKRERELDFQEFSKILQSIK